MRLGFTGMSFCAGQRVMVDIYDDENEKREIKQIMMVKTLSSLVFRLFLTQRTVKGFPIGCVQLQESSRGSCF